MDRPMSLATVLGSGTEECVAVGAVASRVGNEGSPRARRALMTGRLRWSLAGCVALQIVATLITAFAVLSWCAFSGDVNCILRDYPNATQFPGTWLATQPLLFVAVLVMIGNVAPLFILARVREPLSAFITQLACSGAQIILALAAWLTVVSTLVGIFHMTNCFCDDAPEVSIGDLDLTPEPMRSPHGWHGCT